MRVDGPTSSTKLVANHQVVRDNDARTGMPPGIPEGAMCVQRFDDSLNSAIRITFRISLRSSSMPEPRDPLLKVLSHYKVRSDGTKIVSLGVLPAGLMPPKQSCSSYIKGWRFEVSPKKGRPFDLGNDPSAGSPTERALIPERSRPLGYI